MLVRPLGSANVGAAARAMKNMGVGELTLVRPAVRRFAAAEAHGGARARPGARRARGRQRRRRRSPIARLVVGTTCRGGPYRAGAETPEALAPLLLEAAAHGPVAVLFGPEDHGLTNDDLRVCQRLIAIDTSPDYASLNLAQAVLLVCYELRRAALARRPARSPASTPARGRGRAAHVRPPAARAAVDRLPPPAESRAHHVRRCAGCSAAPTLADHEVRILLGIARQIEWAAGGEDGRNVTGDRLPVTGEEEQQPSNADPRPGSASARTTGHWSPVTGHVFRRDGSARAR